MFEVHMEKTRTCIVHVFRAPNEPSACEIARNLERMGGWALLKIEEVADSASTPREYRIRWREDAMGYDVVTDTAAEADTPAAE